MLTGLVLSVCKFLCRVMFYVFQPLNDPPEIQTFLLPPNFKLIGFPPIYLPLIERRMEQPIVNLHCTYTYNIRH